MDAKTAIVTRPVSDLTRGGLAHEDAARLVDAFLAGRNARTLRAYRQDLEDFRAFVAAVDLDDAARRLMGRGQGAANACALGYKASLRDRELSPATINRRLAALRSLVKLARTLGLVGWTLEIGNARARAYRDTRGPGRAGFLAMLATLGDRHDAKGHRDRAVLRLLFDLGLRRAEVVGLNVSDVDLEAGTVSVLGKGREDRETLSLPAATVDALRAWLAVHPSGDGPLFTSFDRADKGQGRLTGAAVYYLVRHCGERAGLGNVRPHGLRHAGITEAVKLAQAHGFGLEEVLDFSRHADVKTLMIYRDRERNVQGRLAELVAGGADNGNQA
jgi:integrase/recombinase XerC